MLLYWWVSVCVFNNIIRCVWDVTGEDRRLLTLHFGFALQLIEGSILVWVFSKVEGVGGEGKAVQILNVIQSFCQEVKASIDAVPDTCSRWFLG